MKNANFYLRLVLTGEQNEIERQNEIEMNCHREMNKRTLSLEY